MSVLRRTILPLAAALLVPLGAVAAAQEPATGTVTGTVTIDDPLYLEGWVCVIAYDTTFDEVGWFTTDEEAHYELTLPPGEYYLQFGGCDGRGVPEFHDDARRFADATTVTVVAGETVTVNAALDHYGVLEGRIVDQFGDPVSCAVTIDDGFDGATVQGHDYRSRPGDGLILANAAPGPVQIQFACPAGYESPAPVEADIEPLGRVDLGTIVAPLQPRSVSGVIRPDDGPGDIYGGCVVALSPAGRFLGLAVAPEGHWSLGDLPVGPVRLAFATCDADPGRFDAEWYEDAADFASATDVVVRDDAPVTGIDAYVTRDGFIQVELQDEQGTMVGGACVWITDPSMTRLVSVSYVWPGGSFGGARVPTGDYRVLVSDCGGGWAPAWYGGTADPATAALVHVAHPGVYLVHPMHRA